MVKGPVLPMVIVVVEPAAERGRALSGRWLGEGIGPFAEQGLNEPLGLAVRAGRIGTGEALGEAVGAAGDGEDVRAIGVAVVTQDALGLDPPAGETTPGPDAGTPTTVRARSSGNTSAYASREESSMQTCVNSQPIPRTRRHLAELSLLAETSGSEGGKAQEMRVPAAHYPLLDARLV